MGVKKVQPEKVRWQCSGCDHKCVLLTDGVKPSSGSLLRNTSNVVLYCRHGEGKWRKVGQAALNRKQARDLKTLGDLCFKVGMNRVKDDIKKIIKTAGFGRRLPAIYKYLGMDGG